MSARIYKLVIVIIWIAAGFGLLAFHEQNAAAWVFVFAMLLTVFA